MITYFTFETFQWTNRSGKVALLDPVSPLGGTIFFPHWNHVNSEYKCHKLLHPHAQSLQTVDSTSVSLERLIHTSARNGLWGLYSALQIVLIYVENFSPFTLWWIWRKKNQIHRQNRSTDLPYCQICLLTAWPHSSNPCRTSEHWCS